MSTEAPETPSRNLPARLEPTLLSSEAANLIHSLEHDAKIMGASKDGESDVVADYYHMALSRMKLIRYISRLEEARHVPQQKFYRFD